MTGSQVTEDVSDAGRRSRSSADPVGAPEGQRGRGVGGKSQGTALVCAAAPRSGARRRTRGAARPRTVDSRTWLWKCCSRADTSSCPSILLHARRRAARVRALRRTIARGRRGCTAARCRTGTPPRPQQARKTSPQPPPQLGEKRLSGCGRRGTATAWAGLEAGAGLARHSEGAVRQRRAPRSLGRWVEGLEAPGGVAGGVGAEFVGPGTELGI